MSEVSQALRRAVLIEKCDGDHQWSVGSCRDPITHKELRPSLTKKDGAFVKKTYCERCGIADTVEVSYRFKIQIKENDHEQN